VPRKRILLAAIVTVLAVGVAHAAPPESRPLFERFKASESKSHRERIRILDQAERCIQAARDREAYRACERQEAAARQALRQEVVKERQALRAELEARRAARPGAQL
jgi:hypothetical protein